jgi:hypothetical protein
MTKDYLPPILLKDVLSLNTKSFPVLEAELFSSDHEIYKSVEAPSPRIRYRP